MDEEFENEEYLDSNPIDGDEEDPFASALNIDTDPKDDAPGATTDEDADDSNADGTDESLDRIFSFTGVFYRRLHRGQLRPREFCRKLVAGDSKQDIFDCIWEASKSQVQRQVVFDGEVPQWSEKEQPDREDIDKFVTLYDQTKKKTYTTSAITPRVLATWRGKEIRIHTYAYSTNVETAALHQAVLRKLITPTSTDRSGANSTRDDAALAQALRDTHPHIEGHQSSWLLWANSIHSAPAHKHDQLKAEPAPPLELTKYFRWTAVSEPARLQSFHRGLNVAHTMNDGWVRELTDLKGKVDHAAAILQDVRQGMDLMLARGATGAQLIAAMEDAVRPEECDMSRELASRVSDCPDTDHA